MDFFLTEKSRFCYNKTCFGNKNQVKILKVIDFFSGCGGVSEGLRQAGFDITIGLDFDKNAAETYQANFEEAEFYNIDIRKLDEKELAKNFRHNNLIMSH
jgi:site-specific DNA-cytosine methylase